MIVPIVATAIFVWMVFLCQNLAEDSPTQKAPDNMSLELLCNKKRFAAFIQENISRYIKRMNPVTQWIYIKQP